MRVLVDGCFDPIHIGHLRYIGVAASFGDVYVNVAPDAAIIAKGRQPFQSRKERANALEHVKGVVAASWYWTLAEAVNYYEPDVLAKGIEWEGRLPPEVMAACAKHGTHIVFTQTQSRTSTERLRV